MPLHDVYVPVNLLEESILGHSKPQALFVPYIKTCVTNPIFFNTKWTEAMCNTKQTKTQNQQKNPPISSIFQPILCSRLFEGEDIHCTFSSETQMPSTIIYILQH